MKDISWGVLPLVAGLFVLVEALGKTGLIETIAALLRDGEQHAALLTAALSGIAIALASNLINNLPAGLMAASAVQTAQAGEHVTRAILIGVDLGPNLSVTGSLATILWLAALAPRRSFGRLRRVPENRRGGDAARSPSCACRRIADAVRPIGGSYTCRN